MARHADALLETARPLASAVLLSCLAVAACGDVTVKGEGQFGRRIALVSDPARPLPRLVWKPGNACPGDPGGCDDFCQGEPSSCADACMPIIIDSGTPLSLLPGDGALSYGRECVELRSGAGLLADPMDPDLLEAATASFRLLDAPIIRASEDQAGGWTWQAGDEIDTIAVGGVIGGNVLRDFALELRHFEGEAPSVTFFTQFPGNEDVLGDQGRAYLRLQHPGRLLGRLLNDQCEFDGLDCRLSKFSLSQNDQELLFESTRALVDACVAPPPCAVSWQDEACVLSAGGVPRDDPNNPGTPLDHNPCVHEQGRSATLVIATGVPGLVLFDDSAGQLLGPLDQLPACDGAVSDEDTACMVSNTGRLMLPGWPPLEQLLRIKVRSLGLVEGLGQANGPAPCQRLRDRIEGLRRQCEGYSIEGLPIRPPAMVNDELGLSVVVRGEAWWPDNAEGANPDSWIETLIVPATAPPVLALRREIVPEGAQPDGLVGGALLHDTETVLDFTEAVESPGVRVRCLDPGPDCLAVPACTAVNTGTDIEDGTPGRTNCCFGLPSNLIARVALEGINKQAPRVEDACCTALPRAAIEDLQSESLQLCTGVDLP